MIRLHPFERAGLGLAPFKFVSTNEKWFQANAGGLFKGPSKPGSSCDYCGTGIAHEFWCVSSDGKKFKVGCDCIEKVGDVKLLAAAKNAQKNGQRAKRQVANQIKREARQAEWDKPKLALIEQGLMPFGKYHGQPLDNVDVGYVKWLFLANTVGAVNIALHGKLRTRYDAIIAS